MGGIQVIDKSTPLSIATAEVYADTQKIVTESVVTDIVEADTDELYRFAQYWKELARDNAAVNQGLIPADLLIEQTIPITDIMIVSLDTIGLQIRVTIKLPDDKSVTDYCNNCGIIGAVTFVDIGLSLPLTVDTTNGAIAVVWEAVSTFPYKYFNNVTPAWIDHHTKHIDVLTTIMGMILPAWYGIQLALLHPVTKQVFATPKMEKRDRKEVLEMDYTAKKLLKDKCKTVKYVRRHTITKDNNVDIAIDSAVNSINQLRETNNTPHKRHTALWRVIGHYRKYKSGKTIWVKPYWKGPLKDFADIKPNKRLIDIPEV